MAVRTQKPKRDKKRVLPVTYEWVELDGDYEGWRFELKTMLPMGQYGKLAKALNKLSSGKDLGETGEGIEGLISFLTSRVRQWNFVDENGDDLDIKDSDSWLELPMDMVNDMVGIVTEKLGKVSEEKEEPSQPS